MTEKRAQSWSIREGSADDIDKIRTLYRATWNHLRPEGFDRWRYLGPPDGLCPMALAVDGDRLAGAYIIWPVKIRVGGETVLGAQSMDTMTHPEFQGQGLFTALASACLDMAAARGFEIVYGFPNPLSYPGFIKRLQFKHTGDITHWVRPISPSRYRKVPAVLGPLADAAAYLLPSGSMRGFECRLSQLASEELLALAAQSDGTVGCRIDRNPLWLDWRYSAVAQNDYEWVCAFERGKLAAVAAWGMRNAAWADVADARGHITELFGNSAKACAAVLSFVIRRARARNVLLLETLTNAPNSIQALRRAGFFAHRQAPFIVRNLTNRSFAIDPLMHDAWRIHGGDVDTF